MTSNEEAAEKFVQTTRYYWNQQSQTKKKGNPKSRLAGGGKAEYHLYDWQLSRLMIAGTFTIYGLKHAWASIGTEQSREHIEKCSARRRLSHWILVQLSLRSCSASACALLNHGGPG
jgi:hypothetical protein